jgi:hypothetical protein
MVRNYQVKNGPAKVARLVPDNRLTYPGSRADSRKLLDRLPRHLAADYS